MGNITEIKEDIKHLYFTLERKNSEEPKNYTMTEIEKIVIRAQKLIQSHNEASTSLSFFAEAKERSDHYHQEHMWDDKKSINEVKELAIRAFHVFFDEEPGIGLQA